MQEVTSDTLVEPRVENAESRAFVWRIFEALETADVDYCLLRGKDELGTKKGYLEIDLLIRESHLSLLAETTGELGFVELPSWGHAPHHFFVAFDRQRRDWVKLDVVTDLWYGKPIRRFRVDVADRCLNEREKNGLFTLSPENEFMTLFLHGLLDKGDLKEAHQLRLFELWQDADDAFRENVAGFVQDFLTPVFDFQTIDEAIASKDWDLLDKKRFALTRAFSSREPLASAWRNISARVLRALRPLFFAFSRRGRSIALLAPDGAGKSTLAASLLTDRMLKARRVYMGTNVEASTSGLPTTRWLHYRIKSLNGKAGGRSPYYLALKALNFGNRLLERWLISFTARYHLLRGRTVIFDRFIYDSWVNKKQRTLWKQIRRSMFEGALPTPDLVIFLDAPGEVLFKRKGEHSPEWLNEQRCGYHALLDRLPQMRIVNAANSAEQVRSEVIDLIWKKYGQVRPEPFIHHNYRVSET